MHVALLLDRNTLFGTVYSTYERRNSAAYGGSYCSFYSREQSVEIKVHGRATTLRSDSQRTDELAYCCLDYSLVVANLT